MNCPRCEVDNPAGARFCAQCGARLDYASPASYTPRHLAEKILTSRSAIEGERKLVTVVFCDISGSTGLAERLGPERMHSLLNRFFELALAEVHRYEGTINQFLGDGFMALFGAPLAHEDHARRAVLAAVGIQGALRERQTEFGLPDGVTLGVRMGLNTGLVVVGKIGVNLRMDYTAVGDTTNLAARLQQLAEPGAIYVSAATYRLVETYVEGHKLGERRLKGKTEPVTVYRLLGTRARPEPGRREMRPIGSPLVGRDKEVAVLTERLQRLVAGEGGIVAVLGEAGLGKSRLVAEVSRQVAGTHVLWLEGRALSFGQTLSYWPFLEILRGWISITEEDSEAESQRKLEHRVHALFPEAADVLPYLATLLGLPVPPELEHRVKYLDGEAMGRQVFRSIRRVFESLARERPVVLVFEDLHWADQSSIELIEHLFPLVETVPLLLYGVGRLERGTPAARLRERARTSHASRYTEIALLPLSSAASATLIDNLVESPRISDQLKDLVLQKTEGNPFFVEEVIRSLITAGVLAWDAGAGQWRVTHQVGQVMIPDTLQGVIMARVDRLDEDVKHVLKVASVIGRSFLFRVLAAIAGVARELDRNLHELQQLELIREKRQLPDLEYFFKHTLVQEAAYESLLVDRRRHLHQQVGRCIETLFADRQEEFYGILAYHYARAEEWDKAQAYLLKAGDQAGRIAADAEALSHYRQAMAAHERAFGDRWEPVQRAMLERKMGEALFRRGVHVQALEHFLKALALVGNPLPTSRWGIRLAILGELARQIAHRLLPRLFLREAGPADPLVEEWFHTQEVICWIDYFTNQERFLLEALKGLNLSEEWGRPVGIALNSMGAGVTCDVIAAFRVAGFYHRRGVAAAEQIQHPVAIGTAYLGLAAHEDSLGDWKSALEHCGRAAAAFRDAGHLRGWGVCTTLLAWLFLLRGDFTEVGERSRELIRVGEESSDRHILALGLTLRGTLAQHTGPLDQAATDLQQAVELSRAIPDHATVAQASALLGRCYLRQGKLQQAQAMLDEAAQVVSERGLRGMAVVQAPLGLAEASLIAAERAEGADRVEALGKAKRACQRAVKQGKLMRSWLPSALRFQGTYEWLRGRPSAGKKSWHGSIAVAEELGARYELGMTWMEMGRRTGERAALERAEVIFIEIGAVLDLPEARRLSRQSPGTTE